MEEEGKIFDPTKPRRSENSFETALWQWQSGPSPDPWAEKDPTKWTWQEYSHDDSLIIEEAFCLKKDVADLGHYEIDLKRMLQVNKQFKNRMRRVRRQEKSRFMMEIPEPVAFIKDQKTMNQAFGTIQHFLNYIMKRTPKAYGLYQRLKMLSLDSKSHEFEDIIKEVVACIEQGAGVREKVVKTRTGSQTQSFVSEATSIMNLILDHSANLRDFLKAVLKAYTMETFICYWLNELLRSENWEEINVLTPYLVCLVYTFKISEYIIKYQEPQGLMNGLRGFVGMKRLLSLFRGAALTKEHLNLYDPERIEYFSWNGVTSTSRDRNVAMNFIRASLGKAQRLNEPKVGVLFIIETAFGSSEDCEGMIDVFQNSCSQYPDEQEVILAPGTVFKLQKTQLIEKDIYEVSLRVKRKFEETKQNIALLGRLQDQAISKDKATIDELPSYQSFRLLEMLKGNKLIQKLEIRRSGVEEHIMEEIENLRATTNVKKEDVKLINNTVVVSDLGLLGRYYSTGSLNDIFMLNKIRFKDEGVVKNNDLEIKTLVLSEESLEKFKQNNQLTILSGNLTSANQIEGLELAFPKMEGSDCEWTEFLQCIIECKGLQSLSLKINEYHSMMSESLEILCQTIGSSKTLNKVHLELSLSHRGLDSFKTSFESIASIQNLSLDLRFDNRTEDKRLDHLKSAIISLKSLQHLSLNFESCNEISDEGLEHLKNGLRELTSLQHFSVSFSLGFFTSFFTAPKISNHGLKHLIGGLLSLPSLRFLSLKFVGYRGISDLGLEHLKEGLREMTSLQHLSLNFGECKQISDKGLEHLKEGLKELTSLRELSLDFTECKQISDEGLSGVLLISPLQHLSLKFEKCEKISDKGLEHLKEGLREMPSLRDLSLDFMECKEISDEGLNHLKNSLSSLSSLEKLSLSFAECSKISDEGLNSLKSAVTSLTLLQHLSLNFMRCKKISDKGLNHLKSGLLPPSSLQDLSLSFRSCKEISDKGLNHLGSSLLPLSSLQHLGLDFSGCNKITNEGLKHLKSGLLPLSSLQDLSLDFTSCKEISDKGLNHLNSGFLSLSSLQCLKLNLEECDKISDKGLKLLHDQLKFIHKVDVKR